MKVSVVTVSVKKMFSDGNYGHQTAEVSYTAELDEGDLYNDVCVRLLAEANVQVAVQLGESETLNIRRAIHPRPRVCNYCNEPLGDWDTNYSHPACEQRVREEREVAREAAKASYQAQVAGELEGMRPQVDDGSDLSDDPVEWIDAKNEAAELDAHLERTAAAGPRDDEQPF